MVVSWFHYAKPDINGSYWYQPKIYKPNQLMPFDNWIKNGKKTFHRLYFDEDGNKKENVFTNDFSGITIEKYISDNLGNRLVNYIVNVDCIKKDMLYVFKALGLHGTDIPHTNVTHHSYYQEYYDETTKNIVANEFQSDIQIGRYKF